MNEPAISKTAPPLPLELQADDAYEVTVILPCLDEALTVGPCVTKAMETFRRLGLRGEVVVVDNGSSDDSCVIAARCGARVVREARRGYGSALMRGAEEARAPFIIMADADNSYDLTDLERFIAGLRAGNDLVMGTLVQQYRTIHRQLQGKSLVMGTLAQQNRMIHHQLQGNGLAMGTKVQQNQRG